MDRLLTLEEVAVLARTTPDTVRYWRKSGRGPRGFRVGKRILYAEADVSSWITEMRSQAGGEPK